MPKCFDPFEFGRNGHRSQEDRLAVTSDDLADSQTRERGRGREVTERRTVNVRSKSLPFGG
jgi:hypothetical protein